jgi:hypothetical protein
MDRDLPIVAFFFTTVHANEQIPTTARTEAKSGNVSLILIDARNTQQSRLLLWKPGGTDSTGKC